MKKILQPDRNCMGMFNVDKTGLLIDGRDYYYAFYRAALKARRYILIAGWQFDSDVALLRGEDVKEADGDVHLLPFLNSLCDKNPELNIYILAWDFNMIYSIGREFLQDWLFNWTSNERIHFLFDSRHAVGASHHQKLVVIDGLIGFVGGMDICSNRWDDRRHLPDNALRNNKAGQPYEQYHDIQSCHYGPGVDKLRDIFTVRWKHAGGRGLSLSGVEALEGIDLFFSEPIEAEEVAVSRTQAKTLFPPQQDIREIRSLYIDAIDAAEGLIYMENQYLSSQAVYTALIDRLKASDRSPLQIVIVLPKQPHSLLENISLGIAQEKMIRSLRNNAEQYGHSMGVYFSAPLSEEGVQSPIYIHAKLLLVDDRFLTVGSANTNNRSMGLDTELNISWEAASGRQEKLIRSIRRARVSLLAEHCGIDDEDTAARLHNIEGLVDFLDTLADDPASRLQPRTIESFIDNIQVLKELGPEDLAVDPETPILEENIYELISHDKTGFFAEGVSWLSDYLKTAPQTDKTASSALSAAGYFLRTRWYIAVLIILGCALAVWFILR